ncbi:MAG: hypothetical protein KDB94_03310 [Acidobacteria bacterium]|nr:hypothetical protein [Acidobacteriota bacterium]
MSRIAGFWSTAPAGSKAKAVERGRTNRVAGPILLLIVAALVAPVTLAAEESEALPVAFRCSGNEPFWGLQIAGAKATYSAMGEETVELAGTFRTLDYAGLFVFRGAAKEGGDWVAFVFNRSCEDTMAEEGEGGGRMPYAVGVSLPGGEARYGCCRPVEPATEPSKGGP